MEDGASIGGAPETDRAVAHVVRNGEERQARAEELVPGDLAVLAAGFRVPADGRVVENVQLQVEEAALTGESLAVTKTTDRLPDEGRRWAIAVSTLRVLDPLALEFELCWQRRRGASFRFALLRRSYTLPPGSR